MWHTHTHAYHTHTHCGRQAHTHAANVFAPSGNKNKFEKLILNVLHWKHIVWQPPTLRHLCTLTLSLVLPLFLSLTLSLFLSLYWLPLCISLASLALIFHMPSRQPGKPLSPSLLPCPSLLTHQHIKTATRRRRTSVRGLYATHPAPCLALRHAFSARPSFDPLAVNNCAFSAPFAYIFYSTRALCFSLLYFAVQHTL